MVQLPKFGKLRPESKQLFTIAPVAVKAEIEDHLDEMYGPLDKRLKITESVEQLQSKFGMPPGLLYDPLDEPSPLGLRLKKSPSFLDMIQMRLYHENSTSTSSATSSGLEIGKKKELKSTAVSGGLDKMKASNFPASILRIGNWEYVSRYEGDLVAKCYYAKHKLVWEVLDGGLKNKIEIQWSDITALKATCPESGPATLDIVLARRPLFFRETNPQPRKHTLWQATSDFTGGQASIHRRHFLQCQQGLLNRHFEKLIQCDPRLKTLNQQPEIVLESSCFEPSCLEDQDETKCMGFDNVKGNHGSSTEFFDPRLPCTKTESRDRVDGVIDPSARPHFHDSGDGFLSNNVLNNNDDLVSHLEHCINKARSREDQYFMEEEEEEEDDEDDSKQTYPERKALDDPQPCACISRKESFGELLMNLPRIASFPQFLFEV